jgi:V/A-type H+-transporting ATPase subunit A
MVKKIGDQMKVVGEEDLTLEDFVSFLKSEFFDSAFLQQNAFDPCDSNPSIGRTAVLLQEIKEVVFSDFVFKDKSEARDKLFKFTSLFKELNIVEESTVEYGVILQEIKNLLSNKAVIK